MKWIKASDRLPLHLGFWQIIDYFNGNQHKSKFPVKIESKIYSTGELYDEAIKGDPPHYMIRANGDAYYANRFDRIEWLDEQPDPAEVLVKALKEVLLLLQPYTPGTKKVIKTVINAALEQYKKQTDGK